MHLKALRTCCLSRHINGRYIENAFAEICRKYGFEEIRTPVFEHTELFQRGVGDTTDIVQKEMYSFQDYGKRNINIEA